MKIDGKCGVFRQWQVNCLLRRWWATFSWLYIFNCGVWSSEFVPIGFESSESFWSFSKILKDSFQIFRGYFAMTTNSVVFLFYFRSFCGSHHLNDLVQKIISCRICGEIRFLVLHSGFMLTWFFKKINFNEILFSYEDLLHQKLYFDL